MRNPIRCAFLALALTAMPAFAQTPPAPLDLQLHALPTPGDDDSTPDAFAVDTTTTIHGSISSGIGYSKTFGHANFNSADVDITKRTDSGNTVGLHVGVWQSSGLPGPVPSDYVTRYPYPVR